jgi:hypothetical protein
MATLEDQIANIEKLDELRKRARLLQEEAIEALTERTYLPQPRKGNRAAWKKEVEKNKKWSLPGDDIEKAEMLVALKTLKPKKKENEDISNAVRKKLVDELLELTYEGCSAPRQSGGLDDKRLRVKAGSAA